MSIKGQKYNKYTKEFKRKVVDDYNTKVFDGVKLTAEHYNISSATLKKWLEKERNGGSVEIRTPGCGRKKKINTNEDYKEKYEILKKYQAFIKAQRKKK